MLNSVLKRTTLLIALAGLVVTLVPVPALASSHNEAPFTSKNPSLDDTDFYMFRDPNDTSMVNIIACRYGLIEPQGGPNYASFADGAYYDINIDNNGDGVADIIFRFTFTTTYSAPNTFLYAQPGITSSTDANLYVKQTYNLDMIKGGVTTNILTAQPVLPPNIGPKTIPNYAGLPNPIQKSTDGKISVFVGPRQDPFFVDLGMTFDAINLETGGGNGRPGVGVGSTGGGRDTLYGYTVLSTALQVPIALVSLPGFQVGDPNNSAAIIGAWASISVPSVRTIGSNGTVTNSGSFVQVSRLGNPLVNEVLVGVGKKDRWNAGSPANESFFKGTNATTDPGELFPVLAQYFNVLFGVNVPGPTVQRDDIGLALFTGLDTATATVFGVSRTKRDGEVYSDQLRLNTAVAPTPFASASRLGYLGGDKAGFPNGRRPCDDVVDIELRVVAGVLLGAPYNGSPNNSLGDGVDSPQRGCRYFFPFMWAPTDGFSALHAGPAAPTHASQKRGDQERGFPEGVSDEEFAQQLARYRDIQNRN